MSPRRRSAEKSKLRMDIYSNNDKNARPKGVVSDKRREIDRVIKKARREGDTTSQYWTKKLLEVEEKEPDRWRHSGYKELYLDGKKHSSGSSDNASPVTKKRAAAMYSPSAPTSPVPASRNSRRSSTPPARLNDRSISSDVRRGSPPPRSRTDKFANSARPQRASISPFRRAKSPANVRAARSPLCRSRSPLSRRTKSAPQRASPLRRTRTPPPSPPSRVRKPSPRRAKSPLPSRSARSPVRQKSPSSRLSKPDRTRTRSNDKLSPTVRRKKSPKVARYKSVSRSLSVSPVRRREKVKPRSPPTKVTVAKRKLAHRTKYRRSSSLSSSASPRPQVRRKNPKQAITTEVLSSSDCSDSNCSMCRFEKSAKEKKKTKADREKAVKRTSPPKEPRLKPRAALPRLPPTSSSRYARSRSLSVSAVVPAVAEERRPEVKRKKKSKKKEKKTVLKNSNSKAVTPSVKRIKVESPSDESESPSPKRITLSERFGKMAKWNQKKDVESTQRNIRVTAGDSYRVEELDVPLLEPFPEPSSLMLDGSWDDVRVRYTYYKDHGYLEDLSFQDYLKWEEWWYSYQEWLENERLHSIRRRL